MWAQAPGIQCSQLADVAPLGAGLEKLQALTSLKLSFYGCSQLCKSLHLDLDAGERAALLKTFSSKESFLAAVGA